MFASLSVCFATSARCRPLSWLVHCLMLNVLLVKTSSLYTKQLESIDFSGHLLAIGSSVDNGSLTVLTSESSSGLDWTLHEFQPWALNVSSKQFNLNDKVHPPVLVSTKWPRLYRNLKSSNISIDNAILVESSRPLLLMSVCAKQGLMVYDLDMDQQEIVTFEKGLLISSDLRDTFYVLLNEGKQIARFKIVNNFSNNVTKFELHHKWTMNICNTTIQVGVYALNFQKNQCQHNRQVEWTVSKGMHYQDQFYLFSHEKVFVFSAIKAISEIASTEVTELTHDKFFHTSKSAILSISSESTQELNSTSKEPRENLTIMSVTIGVIIIVAIIFIPAIFYWIYTKQSVGAKAKLKVTHTKTSSKKKVANNKPTDISQCSKPRSVSLAKKKPPQYGQLGSNILLDEEIAMPSSNDSDAYKVASRDVNSKLKAVRKQSKGKCKYSSAKMASARKGVTSSSYNRSSSKVEIQQVSVRSVVASDCIKQHK